MSKPENDLQVTIRMPSSLKKSVDDFVENTDITSMEFIRRAISEKLERENNNYNSETKYMNKNLFKEYLLEAITYDEEIQNAVKDLK